MRATYLTVASDVFDEKATVNAFGSENYSLLFLFSFSYTSLIHVYGKAVEIQEKRHYTKRMPVPQANQNVCSKRITWNIVSWKLDRQTRTQIEQWSELLILFSRIHNIHICEASARVLVSPSFCIRMFKCCARLCAEHLYRI